LSCFCSCSTSVTCSSNPSNADLRLATTTLSLSTSALLGLAPESSNAPPLVAEEKLYRSAKATKSDKKCRVESSYVLLVATDDERVLTHDGEDEDEKGDDAEPE
jgi:hypothetical protein